MTAASPAGLGRGVGRRGSTLGRLLGLVRPYSGRFAAGILLSVAGAVLDAFSLLLMIPFLRSLFGMGPALPAGGRNAAERLMDGIAGGWLGGLEGLPALRIVCLLVLAAILLKNACWFGSRALAVQVQEYMVRDARTAVHARLQRLPLAFFERGKAGQLLARVLTDTRDAKLVPDALSRGIQHGASAIAYVLALLVLSWKLTLIALALVPILVLAMGPVLRRLRTRYRRVFDDQAEILSTLQETVSGIRLVKAHGAEAFEDARFARRSDGHAREFIRSATMAHLASPLSEVLSSFVAVALVWVGAGMVLNAGTLGPEEFLAFVTIALRSISPIKGLSQYPAIAQQGLAAADRFFEILDEPPEPDGGTRRPEGFRDAIRFENVEFSYEEDRPVLRGVDLTIRRGEVVALVGPSGSGKSTLVDLLPRFADAQRGRVLLDGVDIRELRLSDLRRQIGLVGQETTIFHDTVHANIAYGCPERTREEVRAAARTAHAAEFVERLPDGYDTLLGDRGVRLSGGQRQRIGIARAVLRDAPILILDEATSALDAESERLVRAALRDLFRGRTVLVVAHRLSTVREADRIFVLEAGRVVAEGTHADLVGRDGPYRRLFGHQLEVAGPLAR